MRKNADQQEKDSYYLPPRTKIHKSEKGKWTSRFYQTMLFLFVLLIVTLAFWGFKKL